MMDRDDVRAGTIASETDRWRAGAAAALEHATAGREPSIPMEQGNDRGSLRQQALALALAISMDAHTRESSARSTPASWTLLQPCGAAPCPGGEAKPPRKHPRHVTLVGETA